MSGRLKKQGEGQIKLGTRVIRGPDWIYKNEDNGEGFVGTIVEFSRIKRRVKVIWDTGRSGQYRADPGQYDLRIFDNAPTGESHPNTVCNFCSNRPIHGMKWTCIKCHIDLCTQCYMSNKHDEKHAFKRTDTPECRSFKIGSRKNSEQQVIIRGIFKGAEVVVGPSWMYGTKTDDGDMGYIEEITCWENKYHRGIVSVFWKDSNDEQKYRLGAEGCVDIICSRLTETASGGTVYLNHLPVVDFKMVSEESPKLLFYNSDVVDIYTRIPAKELEFISKRQVHDCFEIWTGQWNTLNMKYINIKMYQGESYADILQEASLISACNHENVLKMYGMTSTSSWIVLEWFSDYTLLQFLKSEIGQKTELEHIFHIAAQVAAGLQYLIERHIHHTDVKAADNILIDNKYTVKITGFHAAVRKPEDASHCKYDVQPYGMLLYELITLGEKPYFVQAEDTYENHLSGQVTEIAEPVTGIPCPDFYYNLMLQCGLKKLYSRPTFAFLHNLFDGHYELQSKLLDIPTIPSSDLHFDDEIKSYAYRFPEWNEIWKGTWSTHNSQPVYIEQCRYSDCSSDVLRQAAIIRSCIHKHVVQLIGISTDFTMIVIERFSQQHLSRKLLDKSRLITFRQTVDFAAQIADGMRYLGTKRIIHRNLKAFNIFVNHYCHIKISGFCCSVSLPDNADIFDITENPNVYSPSEWTAIEEYTCNIITVKSDVWSYGILLTELLSDGAVPYAGVLGNDIKLIVNKLQKGFRHAKPWKCSDVIFKVMLACWAEKPEHRPSFDDLFNFFDTYIVWPAPVCPVWADEFIYTHSGEDMVFYKRYEDESPYAEIGELYDSESIDRHQQEERDLQKFKENDSSSDESLYNDDVEIGSSSDSEDF